MARTPPVILNAVESGEGPPLVLLHGLFGRAANFGTVQRILRSSFRVIALDLRNHGDSPHAPAMDYTSMAGDVLETLRARGVLPAALVGHSMGGKVAMRAALAAPDHVSHLVVSDIAPVRYPSTFADYAAAMAALPLAPGMVRADADAALAATVADPRVRLFLLQNLDIAPLPAWRIGLAEIRAALPDIEGWDEGGDLSYPGPATFVAGGQSDYIRPEHRARIRALFPAARFVTLKDAGHWVHADDPAGFAATVAAALAS